MSLNTVEPIALDAALHRIADDTLDIFVDELLEPSIIRIDAIDDTGFQVGYLPLEGAHPSDLLVGFTAPADWYALGTAARGWSYPRAERGQADRTRLRTDVVLLITRSGEFAYRVHTEDGSSFGAEAGEPAGAQFDTMRRCLGLPTAPPPAGTDVLFAHFWLGELLATPPGALGCWDDVAALHLAHALAEEFAGNPHMIEIGHDLAVASDGVADAALSQAMVVYADVYDWGALRMLVEAGKRSFADCTPAMARWFDNGSFARHLLSGFPSLRVLESAAAEMLPGPIARQLSATLRSARIAPDNWPDDTWD
jgi:hypothetical protein